MEKVFKKSRQRERILEILQDTSVHPTANWVYDRLKAEFPALSLGTVYRNLRILQEQGLVKHLDFGSTFDRFDSRTDAHYHFICESCGKVEDLPMQTLPGLNDKAAAGIPYRITRHRIDFYGLCDACGGQ